MERNEEQSCNKKDESKTEHVNDGPVNSRHLTPSRRDFQTEIQFSIFSHFLFFLWVGQFWSDGEGSQGKFSDHVAVQQSKFKISDKFLFFNMGRTILVGQGRKSGEVF